MRGDAENIQQPGLYKLLSDSYYLLAPFVINQLASSFLSFFRSFSFFFYVCVCVCVCVCVLPPTAPPSPPPPPPPPLPHPIDVALLSIPPLIFWFLPQLSLTCISRPSSPRARHQPATAGSAGLSPGTRHPAPGTRHPAAGGRHSAARTAAPGGPHHPSGDGVGFGASSHQYQCLILSV